MDQLEFEKLISIAIKREIEAYEFYKDVAEKVDDKSVKKIFSDLAGQEMGHHDLLERYRMDQSIAIKFKAPPDFKVAESVNEPLLTTSMKPADAIALAMKKEQQAVEFYRKLADMCDDPGVKDAYLNLANMETQHKSMLEKVFVDIGYPEEF
ncbi:MAG: ferritin family protein [Sedimentisphaerales bacterium]|nr:ferritin family protein [Sedimentisphaerales bacterium]